MELEDEKLQRHLLALTSPRYQADGTRPLQEE